LRSLIADRCSLIAVRCSRVAGRTSLTAGRWPLIAVIVIALLVPQFASACPTCYGAPNSPMTKATNNGIAFLLGTIFFVQIGFIAMFWSFWRHAQKLRRRRESMRVLPGGVI
jgi:hypothetical protein